MSTKKAAKSKSKAVWRGASKSVDDYLSSVPEPARSTLEKTRAAIRAALPAEVTETISYGMPAFKLRKVLLWFAAFRDHCSLFPTAAVIEKHKEELSRYTIAKGTIQFAIDRPLPVTLIRKLAKTRLQLSEGKSKS